jgi:hypothetical protein
MTRFDEGWVVPWSGAKVVGVKTAGEGNDEEYELQLKLRNGNDAIISFCRPFELTSAASPKVLVGSEILRVLAYDSGLLDITFTAGQRLRAQTADDFEAWGIAELHGVHVVALPGGGFGFGTKPHQVQPEVADPRFGDEVQAVRVAETRPVSEQVESGPLV